jgi:enoyl-CoA hydratase/carnithine racemase
VEKLRELYEKWEKDRHVRMVIITGAGRGFCAGGDVATVYHLGKSGIWASISTILSIG